MGCLLAHLDQGILFHVAHFAAHWSIGADLERTSLVHNVLVFIGKLELLNYTSLFTASIISVRRFLLFFNYDVVRRFLADTELFAGDLVHWRANLLLGRRSGQFLESWLLLCIE